MLIYPYCSSQVFLVHFTDKKIEEQRCHLSSSKEQKAVNFNNSFFFIIEWRILVQQLLCGTELCWWSKSFQHYFTQLWLLKIHSNLTNWIFQVQQDNDTGRVPFRTHWILTQEASITCTFLNYIGLLHLGKKDNNRLSWMKYPIYNTHTACLTLSYCTRFRRTPTGMRCHSLVTANWYYYN